MTAVNVDLPCFNQPADFSDRIIDLFISFFQEVFRHMEDFRFSEDENLTQLMIYDKFARNLDAVGKKPALITDLKSINKGDSFLDDLHGVGNSGLLKGKGTVSTDLFNTVLIVHAMSSVQIESRRLAYLAGFSIFGLESEILSRGIHELSVPTVVGEPIKLVTSSQGEIWSTPVTVRIFFQDSWICKIVNSDILQKFAINTNLNSC
jgi:hypothetical protein